MQPSGLDTVPVEAWLKIERSDVADRLPAGQATFAVLHTNLLDLTIDRERGRVGIVDAANALGFDPCAVDYDGFFTRVTGSNV